LEPRERTLIWFSSVNNQLKPNSQWPRQILRSWPTTVTIATTTVATTNLSSLPPPLPTTTLMVGHVTRALSTLARYSSRRVEPACNRHVTLPQNCDHATFWGLSWRGLLLSKGITDKLYQIDCLKLWQHCLELALHAALPGSPDALVRPVSEHRRSVLSVSGTDRDRQRLETWQSQSKTGARSQRLNLNAPWCAEARQRGVRGDSSARLGPVGGVSIAGVGASLLKTRPSPVIQTCRPDPSHRLRQPK